RAPEVAPEPPRAPEPPPEPRAFPLGHPEASGEELEALGVLGPEEIEAFANAGVITGADLLLRAPVKVDRAGERWIPGVTPEGPVILRGAVKRRATRFGPGWRRHEVVLAHDKGDVRCVWLGQLPDEVRGLRPGGECGFAGRLEVEDEVPMLYEGEPLGVDGRGGDWLPAYGVAGVEEPRARAAMRAALRRYADTLADHLPPDLLERYRLMPLAAALRDAHFPSNANRKGRSRLGFDELLQVQLGVALLRQREPRARGVSNPLSHAWIAQAQGMLGLAFSDDQEAAFDDIRRDLRRNQPMQRLLQGDVGAGKHAIVQAAMMLVAEARHQAIFVAPDALTAEHRFLFAEAFFKTVGIEPLLLLGQPTRVQQEALRKGDTLVVYTTQAILEAVPQLRRLGLVVFEEHGPYGAADVTPFVGGERGEGQGTRPDMLVFTPTPVPSAIALNLYGALAMTVIPPAPARGVDTEAFDATTREQAYAHARAAIEAGEQVMVVFPMLRGHDLLSPSEARRLAEVLAQETFPGARIGIFNGGMSREERHRAYDDFQHRRTDVLLATTYVEHGPAVPQASVMIVEQAQQYDLVRLHRLRGHVAYGWKRGKCLLVVGDDPRPEARRAIDLLLQETDGFRIAELDLRQRGVEAVLGERAADAPDFVWADPVQERDLLVRTRQEAMRLLAQDPGLRRRSNRALVMLVRGRFGEDVLPEPQGPGGGEPSPGGPGGNRRRRRRRGR
ncbi:MAG: helicase-related protein, partial [Myxococcota bacterium]